MEFKSNNSFHKQDCRIPVVRVSNIYNRHANICHLLVNYFQRSKAQEEIFVNISLISISLTCLSKIKINEVFIIVYCVISMVFH